MPQEMNYKMLPKFKHIPMDKIEKETVIGLFDSGTAQTRWQSDVSGNFEISLEGFTINGNAVSLKEVIVVE